MLDDPEMMRRSMEMMRDPSAMQNMMRNQDLAISQIENVPGGFSALRRMYEDVQAPMMDAMADGGNGSSGGGSGGGSSGSGSGSGRNNENVNSGAAGTAMPNPWATPSSSQQNRSTGGGGGGNPMNMNMNMNAGANNNMANPFAAMMGNGNANANANPFAAAMANMNTQGNANPWANMNAPGGASTNAAGMPTPNMEQTIQMLEDPMVNQMMESLMRDPNAMQSILQSNPMLRQMTQANPQVAQMLNNPDMMRTMMDPNNLRSMMQMQNAMQGMGIGGAGGGGASGFPGVGASGVPPPALGGALPAGLDFSTLLNQMQSTSIGSSGSGAGSGANVSAGMQGMGFGGRTGGAAAPIPPEQRFRIQLQSLNDMGFDDNRVNIPALVQTHGNVNRAIDMLLTNPTPAPALLNSASIPASVGDVGSGNAGGDRESMDPTSSSMMEDDADDNADPKDASTKKND